MFIDCMLCALEVSWLYVTLIAIVFIIIIIIIIMHSCWLPAKLSFHNY